MKDIYTSLSGSLGAWRHVELLSNNISNVNTAGFRESRAAFGSDGQMLRIEEVGYNAADGALELDNNPHHFALRGDGFFSLANGSYTRDGAFHVDLQGNLVNADGVGVLDDQGRPIVLRANELITVDREGYILGSLSGNAGKLGIFQLNNPRPVGGNLWQGTPVASTAEVLQGGIERSNSDPLRGMVELIEASRFFEAQEKVMRTSDEMRARLNRLN